MRPAHRAEPEIFKANGLRIMLFSLAAATRLAAAQPNPDHVLLPETLKLARLVDIAAEVTGEAYQYNAQELEGTVTLRVPAGLRKEEIPDLLAHMLATRGFTTIRSPASPFLTVVKLEQAAGMSGVGMGAVGEGDGGAGDRAAGRADRRLPAFVTEIIVPKHQKAKVLADAVRGMLSKPGGVINVLGESELLIVSDLVARVEEARRVIARLDTPERTVFREVVLRSVSAARAVEELTALAAKRAAAGGRKLDGEVVAVGEGVLLIICEPQVEERWRELVAVIDRREVMEMRTHSPRFFAAVDVAALVESVAGGGQPVGKDEGFRVVTDELTGSLIVSATATQHERIAALIERLDATDRAAMPLRSFPVRNRPVAELVGILQELIAAGAWGWGGGAEEGRREDVSSGASQSAYRNPFSAAGAQGDGRREGPFLMPDAGRRSGGTGLEGMGSGDGVRQSGLGGGFANLSLTADEATNTLIAIGEPRLLRELGTLLAALDVRQPQVMLEAILVSLSETEALALGVELERLIVSGDNTINLSSLFGLSNGGPLSGTVGALAGFTGVVLNPGEFGVVVTALESINKGRSLSNPKLLVSNNERAIFSSVLQQPITQQTRTGSSDTTFSYGGSESAGTTISVRPQIAQGDHLVLTYSIKLSNFVGASSAVGLPPPKQENSVDSVATIPDGHTVVVGGLEVLTESEAESRIPLLGRIPLVGELFKTRNNGSGRTRFFVFIRASVLRHNSFEDLKYLSVQDAAAMDVDDGWPKVEPRIIR